MAGPGPYLIIMRSAAHNGLLSLLFILLFLTGCTSMDSNTQKSAPHSSTSEIRIGTLIQNVPRDIWAPSQYCLEEEGNLYQGFDYRMGETNLVFPEGADPGPYLQEPVIVVEGHLEKDLTRHIQKLGKCDPDTFVIHMQMRSDWGNPESGSAQGLTTRAQLEQLDWFQVEKVEAGAFISFQPQYADSVPQSIDLTFHNIFEETLPALPFTVHYEGGIRKPMPVYIDEQIPALEPGDSWSYALPMILIKGEETDLPGKYVFSSLILKETIKLSTQKVSFELDIPFYKLGVREGYPNYRKLH